MTRMTRGRVLVIPEEHVDEGDVNKKVDVNVDARVPGKDIRSSGEAVNRVID